MAVKSRRRVAGPSRRTPGCWPPGLHEDVPHRLFRTPSMPPSDWCSHRLFPRRWAPGTGGGTTGLVPAGPEHQLPGPRSGGSHAADVLLGQTEARYVSFWPADPPPGGVTQGPCLHVQPVVFVGGLGQAQRSVSLWNDIGLIHFCVIKNPRWVPPGHIFILPGK